MTIVEFLLARIAEDEKDARLARWRDNASAWRYDGRVVWNGTAQALVANVGRIDTVGGGPHTYDTGPHIARHDPDRVLAECQAKRAIIALHEASSSEHPSPTGLRCDACSDTRHDGWWYEETAWPCPTLRHLAAVYADQPDYRPEWRS